MNDRLHQKAGTGIKGLDDILRGGFPKNRLLLIEGLPGTGKTTLSLQFLLEGVRKGEPVLYFTLSETREELEEVAHSHGIDLKAINIFELSALEEQLSVETQNTLFHPAEVELTKTTQILLKEVERVLPKRVVLDSLSELRLLSQNSLRFRRQLLALKQFFNDKDCTVLVLDDLSADNRDLQIQSIAHGVLTLEQLSPEYGAERRRLNVKKLRGVSFRGGYHDYTIKKGGLQVYPRLIASEHHTPHTGGPVSSGVKELDTLVGGGIHGGTATLIMGPSGGGKSTIAMQYVTSAAERGEPSVFYSFDENINTLFKRAETLNIPLRKYVDSNLIKVIQIDPAEVAPGEFIQQIRSSIEIDEVRMLVIDSLNGYLNAMPNERHLMIQLHELLTYLGQQGVVTFLVYAQHGMLGKMKTSIDLTYLSDNVLLIRNFEFRGAVRKAISVIKKRTGMHEDTIRELKIDKGIKVGPVLENFHGVLTGVPVYHDRNEAKKT